MHVIPQSWAHLHILVSVFPFVGLLFVVGLYIAAMISSHETLKRACLILFALLGLLAIPTYFSGEYSEAAVSSNPKISQDMLDYHYGWALAALAVLMATGIAAAVALWRSRALERVSDN